MKKSIIGISLGVLLLMTGAAQAITYNVDRIIGGGTVTGFIETDGTLGILNAGNITNWVLTLTSPDLFGGSPDVIDYATQDFTSIYGTATSATATQILFDFGIDNSLFGLQGSSSNYWCFDTIGFCEDAGEVMGRSALDLHNVQSVYYDGQIVIASVSAVPLPLGLPLFAGGLGVIAMVQWRKNRKSAVSTQKTCPPSGRVSRI